MNTPVEPIYRSFGSREMPGAQQFLNEVAESLLMGKDAGRTILKSGFSQGGVLASVVDVDRLPAYARAQYLDIETAVNSVLKANAAKSAAEIHEFQRASKEGFEHYFTRADIEHVLGELTEAAKVSMESAKGEDSPWASYWVARDVVARVAISNYEELSTVPVGDMGHMERVIPADARVFKGIQNNLPPLPGFLGKGLKLLFGVALSAEAYEAGSSPRESLYEGFVEPIEPFIDAAGHTWNAAGQLAKGDFKAAGASGHEAAGLVLGEMTGIRINPALSRFFKELPFDSKYYSELPPEMVEMSEAVRRYQKLDGAVSAGEKDRKMAYTMELNRMRDQRRVAMNDFVVAAEHFIAAVEGDKYDPEAVFASVFSNSKAQAEKATVQAAPDPNQELALLDTNVSKPLRPS